MHRLVLACRLVLCCQSKDAGTVRRFLRRGVLPGREVGISSGVFVNWNLMRLTSTRTSG